MKQINPISMWVNGKNVNADFITLYSVNDNLQTSATFYYQLSSADNQNLASGNLTMSGEDYIAWGNGGGINLAAFEWAALQLNITLL
jgi:hypothetical protein